MTNSRQDYSIGSMWGVLFASLAALSVGVCVSAAELMLRKVDIVNAPSLEKSQLKVLFVRGSEDPTSDWQEKMGRFTEHAPRSLVSFSEGDLNTFFRHAFGAASPDAKVSVNLRITDRYFQMALLAYPTFVKYPICLQSRGVWKKEGGHFVFVPHRAYVGSLPLPGFLAQPLIDGVLTKAFSSPDGQKMVSSWAAISDIRLENGRMRLLWPAN